MALAIRLTRGGAKKRPYYKIVIANSRSPRDGAFIEKIGTYNPLLGKDPSIGQILLMSKAQLQQRVLGDPRLAMYQCGRQDIRAGVIDRRIMATLEFLAASGLKPTVSGVSRNHGSVKAIS